jgi:nucleotide-binding universal stress UspA family protein
MKLTPKLDAIRQVLCPVNYTPSSQTALEHAAALAANARAELTVAHIEEDTPGERAQDSLRQLCYWIPATVRAHCAVKQVVKHGSVAEQIVEEAAKSRADLLVIGAQPRSLLGSVLLGSTTELVIQSAPFPVLSVIGRK